MGYKRNSKTGKWEAFYSKRHPITRQPKSLKRINLRSEAEAKRVERELILLVNKKLEESTVPTWSWTVDRYLQVCEENGLTKKTIYNASCCLSKNTIPIWGEKIITQITANDIRNVVRKSPHLRTDSNRKSLLKFIRGVFQTAVDLAVLQSNPCPSNASMNFKIREKIKKVLTEEQVRHLLSKAKELKWEWYPHVTLALYTGMRSGELYALTFDKIDFESRQILVNRSWNNKDGFKDTKSGHDRIVEIAPPLLPMLKRLKLSGSSEFVLPRLGRWDKGEQARELRMFLTAIGLDEARFHDLRATWCTLLLSKGVEPVKVMKLGGWRNLSTMQDYLRKSGIDVRGTTDCLDFHDPSTVAGKVVPIVGGSDL